MKTIAFIDHSFHKKTKSSNFFIDILKDDFEVIQIYIDPIERDISESINEALSADIVLLWQMDYLAPAFLAKGIPTVVIPMYDGSAAMSDAHWEVSSKALFINFSLTLHARIESLGLNSKLLKYYPKPVPSDQRATFDDTLKAFFWQRRPEDGLSAQAIFSMMDSPISHIHIHNAPDSGNKATLPSNLLGAKISSSTWFANSESYGEIMDKHNIYIAPRYAEGIGMGFLEAMAKGMLVLAYDMPTHNEYISNWSNGILFNLNNGDRINIGHDQAQRMGALAAKTVEIGYEHWLASVPRILNDIQKYAETTIEPMKADDFLVPLAKAYSEGGEVYERYLSRMSSSLKGLLPKRAQTTSKATSEEKQVEGLRDTLWLTNGFLQLDAYPRGHVTHGEVRQEDNHLKLLSYKCDLEFKLDLSVGLPANLEIDFGHKSDEVKIIVVINDKPIELDGRTKAVINLAYHNITMETLNKISIITVPKSLTDIFPHVSVRRISLK